MVPAWARSRGRPARDWGWPTPANAWPPCTATGAGLHWRMFRAVWSPRSDCPIMKSRRPRPSRAMAEIRALIVDDEPLARRGVRQLLAAHPDIVIAGECRDGREALRALATVQPDLV